MTQSSPLTRTATFHARPDHGQALAERLLHAATLVAEAPGCELWLVHRDQDDPDEVFDGRALGGARPGRGQGWTHRHRVAEEIYVVVSGSIKGDGEMVSEANA
jgi:mannose-6-phosphate isomerase-like protein (cupin superfamily)